MVCLNFAIERCVHVPSIACGNTDQVGSKAVHVHINGQQLALVVIVVLQRRNDRHVAANVDAADLHIGFESLTLLLGHNIFDTLLIFKLKYDMLE